MARDVERCRKTLESTFAQDQTASECRPNLWSKTRGKILQILPPPKAPIKGPHRSLNKKLGIQKIASWRTKNQGKNRVHDFMFHGNWSPANSSEWSFVYTATLGNGEERGYSNSFLRPIYWLGLKSTPFSNTTVNFSSVFLPQLVSWRGKCGKFRHESLWIFLTRCE